MDAILLLAILAPLCIFAFAGAALAMKKKGG